MKKTTDEIIKTIAGDKKLIAREGVNRLFVEFHIIQPFPLTNLNRDDVGEPKTVIIGGTKRARVSSQCWKRQVRRLMHEYGIVIGTRTRKVSELISQECIALGATEAQAKSCGDEIQKNLCEKKESKKTKKQDEDSIDDLDPEDSGKEKDGALIFLSKLEIEKIATKFKENGFDPKKTLGDTQKQQISKILQIVGKPNFSIDGLDIALYGRMIACAKELDVKGAASFAHAFSPHQVINEIDFYTASDDLEDNGAAHLGASMFNSATYYRYVSLDITQLIRNQDGISLQTLLDNLETFVKSLYFAVPMGKQNTMAGFSPWEYAVIYIRNGQELTVPFETAVKAEDGGFLEPCKKQLCDYLNKKEKLAGKSFMTIQKLSFGEDENYNLDLLISDIKETVKKALHND